MRNDKKILPDISSPISVLNFTFNFIFSFRYPWAGSTCEELSVPYWYFTIQVNFAVFLCYFILFHFILFYLFFSILLQNAPYIIFITRSTYKFIDGTIFFIVTLQNLLYLVFPFIFIYILNSSFEF